MLVCLDLDKMPTIAVYSSCMTDDNSISDFLPHDCVFFYREITTFS